MSARNERSSLRRSARVVDPRIRIWLLIAAGVVLFLVLGIQAVTKSGSEWELVYVEAARRLLAGTDIYVPGTSYLYPPFPALLALPFTGLPPLLLRLAWYLVSVASALAMIGWSWRLSEGGPAARLRTMPASERMAGALGVLCGATYLLNGFAHQQTDALIGFLMLAGCLALVARREMAAGGLLGLAASFKATPLLWVAYLLLRRRFVAAIMTVLAAVGASLLPELVNPAPDGSLWIVRWLRLYVLPTQSGDTAVGTWGSAMLYNQSLAGLFQRLGNMTFEWQGGEIVGLDRPALAAPVLRRLLYAVLGLLMAASAAAILFRRRSAGEESGPDGSPRTLGLSLEFSLVLLLMVLASPMSSAAHFGTLILPGFCLARIAVRTGDRLTWTVLIASAVLALVPNKDLVGRTIYSLGLWYGVVTAETLLLWFGCAWALFRRLPDVGFRPA